MNNIVPLPSWIKPNEMATLPSPLPAWQLAFRQKQWDILSQKGLPTRRHERFKYTDLSFLAFTNFSSAKRETSDDLQDVINHHRLQRGDTILLVMINGYFMPSLSDIAKLPKDVQVSNISDAWQTRDELLKQYWPTNIDADKHPLANLNAALSTDGLFFHLPDQCDLSAPLHFLSIITDEKEFAAHPQHLILLGENSKLTWVEEYFSLTEQAYLMNSMSNWVIGQDAKLDYYKIQQEGPKATHLAHVNIQQQQNSQVKVTHFSFGSLLARDEVVVTLQEPGAECRTGGFYHLHNRHQCIDYHIDIRHAALHTCSEMLYKGILEQKSRAIFNGSVYVEPHAQKISAYQANHNLLLSNEAEVYSKPELEIYANDVKCKHGATTGQLDPDALFYLRARGISHVDAVNMLLQGFAEEMLARITQAGIKMRVQESMGLLT